MLLAVDIGNTNIACGIFAGNKTLKKFNIPTREYNFGKLKLYIGKADIQESIICSVVPSATRLIEKHLERLIRGKVYILGKNIHVPIKNLYQKPNQVGQDRLVNAFAGIKLYGAPLVVVDFGTAVTFDVISKNKEYLGGMILPGLRISLDVLNQRTALLPKIKLSRPREFIGRNTKNSMLSGIVYGLSALTDDLVGRIKQKIGKSAKVIATGGDISLIGGYCHQINRIDSDLTLQGLKLIYQKL